MDFSGADLWGDLEEWKEKTRDNKLKEFPFKQCPTNIHEDHSVLPLMSNSPSFNFATTGRAELGPQSSWGDPDLFWDQELPDPRLLPAGEFTSLADPTQSCFTMGNNHSVLWSLCNPRWSPSLVVLFSGNIHSTSQASPKAFGAVFTELKLDLPKQDLFVWQSWSCVSAG